jgi:predicted nucleic acid-binding protein
MFLVIDTNVVLSALVKASATRRILFHPDLELVSPNYLLEEMNEHEEEIIDRIDLDPEIYQRIKDLILSRIEMISHDKYMDFYPNAETLMKDIDPDDSAFIAVSLALECDGIWSNDKALHRQSAVKIFSTTVLMRLLEIKK